MKIIYTILIFELFVIRAYSFDKHFDYSSLNAGMFLGYSYIYNQSKIPILKSENFQNFNNGTAPGYSLGITSSIDMKQFQVFVFSNLLFESRPAYLEANNNESMVWDENSQTSVPLVRDFEFDSDISYFVFNFGGGWKPINKLPIGLNLALDIGYPFINSDFVKKETLSSPEGVRFENTGNSRIYEKGKLENPNISLGISGGVHADFKIYDNISIRPMINYRFPLNSTVSAYDWRSDIITLSASLLWNFDLTPKEKHETPDEAPRKIEPVILADFKPDIIEQKDPEKNFIKYLEAIPLNIEETVVTQTYPLLPYIFFDSASSRLRHEYETATRDRDNFLEDSLPKNNMSIYYGILDIIAYRLTMFPDAKLTVRGLTDGRELDSLNDRIELAEDRAVSVKNFLVEKWDIDGDRIKLQKQNLPDLPTIFIYTEGLEENRRVELSSDNYFILSPIIHSKFIEFTSKQNKLLFYSAFEDRDKIISHDIFFYSNNEKIYGYHAEGNSNDEFKIIPKFPK